MTQPHDINRRGFLKCASLASIATLAPALGKAAFAVPSVVSLMGNRFVTLCIMIRTTPWEVSRDVKLHPRDEYAIHTLEHVQSMRDAFRKSNPEGRLTWGFTLNALEDKRPNFREIRDYVVTCQKRFGDEVSYFPGYFPAMHLPRARVNREMSEAIEIISELVGDGYRPQSIMGGFLSSDNLRYLAEEENIHAAHGVIWSQHAIDGGGADGIESAWRPVLCGERVHPGDETGHAPRHRARRQVHHKPNPFVPAASAGSALDAGHNQGHFETI